MRKRESEKAEKSGGEKHVAWRKITSDKCWKRHGVRREKGSGGEGTKRGRGAMAERRCAWRGGIWADMTVQCLSLQSHNVKPSSVRRTPVWWMWSNVVWISCHADVKRGDWRRATVWECVRGFGGERPRPIWIKSDGLKQFNGAFTGRRALIYACISTMQAYHLQEAQMSSISGTL